MGTEKILVENLDNLNLLYSDLNRIIARYAATPKLNGEYMFEWKLKKSHRCIRQIVHDNQYLYINCFFGLGQIYRYSFDGKPIKSLELRASVMEMVNNQLYLMDDTSKFFLVDIQTNLMIQSWDLPEGGGCYLKVDQENLYFTPRHTGMSNYVYFYSKNGKEIKKFGNIECSKKEGEFDSPEGLTVDEKYLYVCDTLNNRVQVIDKKNGLFIRQWKGGISSFVMPRSILLYDNFLYVGEHCRIQVFSKKGYCLQLFGSQGDGEGEFGGIIGLCIGNEKLFILDIENERIQVWK